MNRQTIVWCGVFVLIATLARSAEPGGGFELAPDRASFDDPVQHGAADPSAVFNVQARALYVYYTQRRAAFTTGRGVEWMYGSAIGIASTTDGKTWKYLGTAKGDHDLSDPVKARCTWWAPEVKRIGGTYHMWVANPDGIYTDWEGHSHIRHFTSDDGLNWKYQDTPDLKSANVIDPGVCKTGDEWTMWYKDPSPGGFTIFTASSPDLKTWTARGAAFDHQPDDQYEAPFVFRFKGTYWLIVDTTKNGCDVFKSEMAKAPWTRAGHLWGAHMGVVELDGKQYLVCHRGLHQVERPPGSTGHESVIDLKELDVNDKGELIAK
jgi:hypothetical protein